MTKTYITRGSGLRARKQPSTSAAIVGDFPAGAKLAVDHNVTVGTDIWHALRVTAGGVPLRDASNAASPAYLFSAHRYQGTDYTVAETVTPPPISTGKTRLGVNVVTGNGDVARRALAAGCNAISIINNFQLAADLANDTSITVMARRYVSSMPPPDPDLLFEGAQSPHVVYLTPLNECDVICYGSPEEIARRAGYDREMWRKMKARGRKYAGGGFSVGTPDYTRPDICDAMRTHYAPLYNEGMAINYHLYSPTPTHAMDEWYEGRWRFLFTHCGFDPNPNLAGIYCDETGLDEGGVGGFPAHGMSATQIGAWCRRFLDYSQDGDYAGLLRAAVLFQAGNVTDWRGYNVDYAFAEIGAAARGNI